MEPNELELKKLEILEKRMEYHDKVVKRKSIVRIALGLFLGLIVSLSLYSLFTRSIPEGNKDIVIAIVSGLTGAFFGAVVNFYFGDSDGHSETMPSPKPTTPTEDEMVGKN